MRNKVIIGANFGDEGKGLMTDYFVSLVKDCVVVRFNGGAQAGHTVETSEGRRHVFSHFGAGSFLGAPTYLSQFFIVNPLLYLMEEKELGFTPKTYMDYRCLVTTPYDIHINQVSEILKGSKKHGSCGIGINETIRRSEQCEFALTGRDLDNPNTWKNKIGLIASDYYPQRMEELGAKPFNFDLSKIFRGFEKFINSICFDFGDSIRNRDLVFEGAQGLLLDQNHFYFPHVTRSNTGFQNVRRILEDNHRENDDTEVIYVTRTYVTRHGAGPFPAEITAKPYPNVFDSTNVAHEFQGDLRLGFLSLPGMTDTILKDSLKHKAPRISLAVTCVDQIDRGHVKYFDPQYLRKSHISEFLELLSGSLGNCKIYTSYGKTRNCVTRRF